MKFEPGDKVKRKRIRGDSGTVVRNSSDGIINYGPFKIPVKFSNESNISYCDKNDLELLYEPNDLMKILI